jgi:pimeloyl-ACP methyl ester carboxylesterase
MRVLRLCGAAAFAVWLTACSSNAPSFTPPQTTIPNPVPVPQRGKVDGVFQVGVIKKSLMERGEAGSFITDLGGPPQCDVVLYSITYETVGVSGEPANASAAFYVPGAGCHGPFPLVGYSHGTTVVRSESMTHAASTSPAGTFVNPESLYVAAIWAAHGYAVAATDYLGLGLSSYPFHPYVHADSEATAVVDAMRAARSVSQALHVRFNGKVFLNGYSQGGHSTLATERTIESQNAGEFNLTAVGPDSGPYSLDQSIVGSIGAQSQGGAIYSTYLLTAYQKIYGNVYDDPADAFRSPYSNYVQNLLPVANPKQAAALSGHTLPILVSRLFQPSFLSAIKSDPSNGVRVDLYENSLLHGWKAKTPQFFCGGKDDPVVNFQNSIDAYHYFQKNGTHVTLLDVNSYVPPTLPRTLYHDAVLILCEPLTRKTYFDPLKG